MSKLRAALSCSLLLSLTPLSAQAGDGRLEINQACVDAGCFAGDTEGFPVQLGAGSYVLTSSLSVPAAATTAILISAADADLDLNGFSIAGPVVCTGEPASSCDPNGNGRGVDAPVANVRIHGGTVRGFGAEGLNTGTDARIWDMTVASNGGIGIVLSRGGSVRNSSVLHNGDRGITANVSSGFAEVAGCTVRGNAGDGVIASAGLIVDSRFQNNSGQGIDGSAAAGRNVLISNGSPQISVTTVVIACNQVASVAVCPP